MHGIATLAGGTIKVYSQPGQGTVLHVLLPSIDLHQQAGATPQPQAIPRGQERILLVDDEEARP